VVKPVITLADPKHDPLPFWYLFPVSLKSEEKRQIDSMLSLRCNTSALNRLIFLSNSFCI
jgi:hypothetical protein